MPVVRDLIYAVVAVAVGPILLFSMWFKGKHRGGWREKFGHVDVPRADGKTLMIHAVSVGEVNATRTLIDALLEKHSDRLRIVLSTTTDTGYARARSLYEGRCHVVRYPLDFSWMVRRFLNRVRPDAVLLMELELWPTFVATCAGRGIPVGVINGRLSERSFRGYRRFKAFIGPTFRKLAVACVQDDAYAERFAAMGVPTERLHITGTMKWDTAEIADHIDGMDELAAAMGIDRSRPLVVAGSTGPGEEPFIHHAMASVDLDRPVQVIYAPRKPERFDEAAAALGQPVRRSQHPDGSARAIDETRDFLLDTLGELRKAYALADVVIVGRSFIDLYGSDMMEPVALGKPTIVGPRTGDFDSTMKPLLAGRGIVQTTETDATDAARAELGQQVARLFDPAIGEPLGQRGQAIIAQQRGATQRHLEHAERLLGLD